MAGRVFQFPASLGEQTLHGLPSRFRQGVPDPATAQASGHQGAQHLPHQRRVPLGTGRFVQFVHHGQHLLGIGLGGGRLGQLLQKRRPVFRPGSRFPSQMRKQPGQQRSGQRPSGRDAHRPQRPGVVSSSQNHLFQRGQLARQLNPGKDQRRLESHAGVRTSGLGQHGLGQLPVFRQPTGGQFQGVFDHLRHVATQGGKHFGRSEFSQPVQHPQGVHSGHRLPAAHKLPQPRCYVPGVALDE